MAHMPTFRAHISQDIDKFISNSSLVEASVALALLFEMPLQLFETPIILLPDFLLQRHAQLIYYVNTSSVDLARSVISFHFDLTLGHEFPRIT